MVEISCHGSPVVLEHCLQRAIESGARLAEPGEFTLRAYINGRIDLPQAEAVRDLIEATTVYQARVAAQQIEGSVSKRIQPIKEKLLELISLLEAGIDFAEDDVSCCASRRDTLASAINRATPEQIVVELRNRQAGLRRLHACDRRAAPMSGKAASSIDCSNRIGRLSRTSRAPLVIWCQRPRLSRASR